MPASRPARARLIAAAGSLAAFAVAAGPSEAGHGALADVVRGLVAVGLIAATAALALRLPMMVPWAVLAIAAGYETGNSHPRELDAWSAVAGVLLLLGAELAAWSIEHDRRIRTERPVVVRRAAMIGAVMVAALLVNLAVLSAASLSGGADVAVAAAGVCASVAAVAYVVRLARAAG